MSNGKIVLDDSAIEFLQEEVGGGTTVAANPELVGDEPYLTGLLVGDAKYKVPQGGGAGIEYVELEFNSSSTTSVALTEEQLTKLQNGAFIKAIDNSENPKTYTLIPFKDGLAYSSVIYSDITTIAEAIPFEYVQCSIIPPVELGEPTTAEFHKFVASDLFNQTW